MKTKFFAYFKWVFFIFVMLFSGCSYLIANTANTACNGKVCKVSSNDIYFTYQKADNNRILIDLSAKTSGWIAVGFGATNDMKNANIIMGYVKDDGKVMISNEYGVGKWSHQSLKSLNAQSEVQLVSGSYKDGWTHLSFTLPINPEDKIYGKVFKTGQTISVILAYGRDGEKNFDSYHQYRAKGEIVDFKLP